MDAWIWIAVALGALVAGTVLSTLAQSLRDVSRTRLEEIASKGALPRRTRRVERILDDPEGHAAASALPRIACNLVFVVAIVLWITALRGSTTPTWVEASIGVGVSSVVLWVLGFVLPTSIAKHAAEPTIYAWSGLIRVVSWLASPVTPVVRAMDEVIRRLVGRAEDPAAAVEHELLSVVEDASDEGGFDEAARDMIEAVVKFRNRTVGQVMTPRTEIKAMRLTNDLSVVTAMIRRVGHSRIPVYEENLDHVVGIFYVKDLMRWLAGEGSRSGKTFDLRKLLRPAIFVPETKTVRDLLPELLQRRVHIAMVADEYGGTAGLITFEDIAEEVFGDIQDEYEAPDEELPEVKIDPASRTAEIDARTYVEDANAAIRDLGTALPTSDQYDTVGGFVTVTLGRIPEAGETFDHADLRVTVVAAEPTRVTRVRLAALGPAPEPRSPDGETKPDEGTKASDSGVLPALHASNAETDATSSLTESGVLPTPRRAE